MGEKMSLYERTNRLLKSGFFHIFGSSVLNKIISFLSSVVLVRILTKSEYGIFTYAWNIYSIVLLFNGLGVDSAILQLCSERSGDEGYAQRVCSYGTRVGIGFNVLLTVVMIGIALFAPLTISGARELLLLLCLLPMIQLLFNLSTSYLRAQKRNQDFALLSTVNTALVFFVSAGGAIAFREKGMAFGYYTAYAISVLLGAFKMRVRLFNKQEHLEEQDSKALLSIGAVSMCNNGLSQLLYLLGVFVLGIVVADETVLASYKTATLIPTALNFIPTSLVIYLYPYFAEHRDDGAWCLKRYKQVVLGVGAANAVISLILVLGAPLIIRLLFGEQYLDAVPVFRVLSSNYFLSGTFQVLAGNLLVTQRKLKYNLLVAIISGLVNIAANFLFIQWWGSMGAALATVCVVIIASVMNTCYLVYTFRKNAQGQQA
jgi:O-antigen/teichoic acid export membrane protein